MPNSCHAYYTVRQRLYPFLVEVASKPQIDNISLLTFGLFAALHCQLPRIAAKLPLAGGVASSTQRLVRLVKNKAIQAPTWYLPVARFLLCCFAGGSVRLIMDATDLGERLPMLFVAVAYRGRALPLYWRMLPAKGCSPFSEQKALLAVVAQLVPLCTQVTLLTDREYGSAALMRLCHKQGWHFCLRAKKNRWFVDKEGQRRQMQRLPLQPGQRLFFSDIGVPDLPEVTLSLSCGWSTVDKDDEPWYILSDLPADARILALYAVRFRIEEMFRDFKEQGFRLETTHLCDAQRVSRLVLCVCLAYVWLLNAGVWLSKRGLRKKVDRHTKRQFSYFQIGLRHLQQAFARGEILHCAFTAYA